MFSPDQWLASTGVSFYNDVATQSLRFDDGSDMRLTRSPSSATNQKKYTFSCWVKRSNLGTNSPTIFGAGNSHTGLGFEQLNFTPSNALRFYRQISSVGNTEYVTTRLFRDTSSWYHIVAMMDAANTIGKIYVNGVRETSFSTENHPTNVDGAVNSTQLHAFGNRAPDGSGGTQKFDGYLAEVNFLDGLNIGETNGYLDEFGEVKNGVWIPKEYTGSYGTNGFRLQFNQTGTGTASSSTIGADTSGNTHHFTSSGIVASDCNMPDSPENNFATALGSLSEPLDYQSYYKATYSEGNLKVTGSSSGWSNGSSNFGVTSGKWYAECRINAKAGTGYVRFGMRSRPARTYDEYFWGDDGTGQVDGTSSPYSSRVGTYIAGDILMIALDLDNNALYFGKDGTWENSATSSEIANGTTTNAFVASSTIIPTGADNVGQAYFFYCQPHSTGSNVTWNFGQDSQFANSTLTAGTETPSEGAGVFKYAVPTGFKSLCSANLNDDNIPISPAQTKQADDYFGTLTYIGNGTDSNSTQNIRVGGTDVLGNIDFKPDWTWIKSKSNTSNHILTDSTRLAGNVLFSNLTNDESDNTAFFTSFETNGFNLAQNGGDTNANGYTYFAWNWKANGGTTSTIAVDSVSSGVPSIASTVQANTDAGFSIVTYTGTGSSATVGHGLGATADVVIIKNRDVTSAWMFWCNSFNGNDLLLLDDVTSKITDSSVFDGTIPTSSVFSVGTNFQSNGSGQGMVAYCFAEIEGYSKFGRYTGNGATSATNSDGVFAFLGFRPAFIIIKNITASAEWLMVDSVRSTFNEVDDILVADDFSSESDFGTTNRNIDFLSNGFKIRNTSAGGTTALNTGGSTYIYMAFAEAPFKYANAR